MELGNLMFGNSRGMYPIEREDLQETFYDFLNKTNIDNYGRPLTKSPLYKNYNKEEDYTETEKFIIRPYYWGEDPEKASLPNFVYKSKNIEIQWYKYPLRDSYSNIELTKQILKDILEDCLKEN